MGLGDGKATKESKEVTKELGYILDAVSTLGDQLISSFQDAVDGAGELGDKVDVVGKTMQRGLVAGLKEAVKNSESLIQLQAKVTRGMATQKDIAKESEKIANNQALLDARRETLGNQLTKRQKTLLNQQQQQLNYQKENLDKIKSQNIAYQKSKSLLQIAKENAGGLLDKMDKTGTASKILSGGVGSVLTSARLLELVVLGVFNAMVDVDKQSGVLAKNLNISYNEATALNVELTKAANETGYISITTKGLGDALMAVNGELGIFNTTIDANLITFQKLHKTAGLTYDELGGVNKITIATGGDLEKNTAEIMAQARLTGQKFKVALNEKDVLKDISKVSAATTLSLGKNPGQIAAAVATAKSLGMEMSKVEGIADSLLNFESSIAKEMEAELLTGKSLNLEKARQFALNNDIAGVAREIAKEAGSAADFGRMNRIQQEALAGAVGLSREELAKSLFVQEQIGNLTGDEYAIREKQINQLEAKGLSQAEIKKKLGKESIEDLKAQNSVQEKLEKSVAKMKETFVSLAGPLMQLINPIIDLLIPAISSISFLLTPVYDMFQGIAGILTGNLETLDGFQTALGAIAIAAGVVYGITKSIAIVDGLIVGYKVAQNALEKSKQKGIFGTIGAMTVALGIQLGLLSASLATNAAVTFGVGVAVAVAAAMAGYAAIKSMTADDMMSPGANSSGYGSRTLMGPEGAIALNNKDTVIAGTDLFGDNKQSTTSQTVIQPQSVDTSKMEKLLESLINKPTPSLNMDSIEVGTVAGMSAYSIQ
tara:strand:- start:1197 stop:3512 length:2316 start_codon:yes stop_codon:yes gene_type:complete